MADMTDTTLPSDDPVPGDTAGTSEIRAHRAPTKPGSARRADRAVRNGGDRGRDRRRGRGGVAAGVPHPDRRHRLLVRLAGPVPGTAQRGLGADPVRALPGHRRYSRLAPGQSVHSHGVAQDLAAGAQLHHQRVQGQRRRGKPDRDLRGGGVESGGHSRGRVRGRRLRGLRARPERDRHPPSGHPVPLRRLRGRPGVAALGPRHGGGPPFTPRCRTASTGPAWR